MKFFLLFTIILLTNKPAQAGKDLSVLRDKTERKGLGGPLNINHPRKVTRPTALETAKCSTRTQETTSTVGRESTAFKTETDNLLEALNEQFNMLQDTLNNKSAELQISRKLIAKMYKENLSLKTKLNEKNSLAETLKADLTCAQINQKAAETLYHSTMRLYQCLEKQLSSQEKENNRQKAEIKHLETGKPSDPRLTLSQVYNERVNKQ